MRWETPLKAENCSNDAVHDEMMFILDSPVETLTLVMDLGGQDWFEARFLKRIMTANILVK